MTKTTLWVSIASCMLLVGCTSKDTPMKHYLLETPQAVPIMTSSPYGHKTLKVAYPVSLGDSISSAMNFSYSALQQGSYLNSEWSDDAGKLLQGITIDALQKSRLFYGVVSYDSSVEADYRLECSVFDFSHRIRGDRSDALLSVQCTLISSDTGKLVKTKRFSYVVPTKTIDAKGYAASSNEAIAKLSRDLVLWIK